jgi:hypothetical protein
MREFKRNISRLNRSPLSSGLQPNHNIYFPTLRSSYQYHRVSLGPDAATTQNDSALNVTRESQLNDSVIRNDSNYPESTQNYVRRKLETSRARRIKPLMTPQDNNRSYRDVMKKLELG